MSKGFWAIALAAFSAAGITQGGPPPQPPGSPPKMGPGGNGVGQPRSGQPRNQQQSVQSVYIQILARSDVQADLQVTAAQRTQLGLIAQQKSQSSDQAVLAQIAQVLTPDQVTRLKQLYIQYLGYSALASSEIQDALSLSAEQKARIQSILTLKVQGALNSTVVQPNTAKLQLLPSQIVSQLAKVLTSTQDAQIKAMAGKQLGSK